MGVIGKCLEHTRAEQILSMMFEKEFLSNSLSELIYIPSLTNFSSDNATN